MTPGPGERCGRPHLSRTEEGVELLVHDDARPDLVRRILEEQSALKARALRLMRAHLRDDFARDPEAFFLDRIEVFAGRTAERGDFALTYSVMSEPRADGDTFFTVSFFANPPPQDPFWPFQFRVGFQ